MRVHLNFENSSYILGLHYFKKLHHFNTNECEINLRYVETKENLAKLGFFFAIVNLIHLDSNILTVCLGPLITLHFSSMKLFPPRLMPRWGEGTVVGVVRDDETCCVYWFIIRHRHIITVLISGKTI